MRDRARFDVAALVERLRANGSVFEALTKGVSPRQARWKPVPEQWSMLEVINHLADEEVEDFRTRLDLTLHDPGVAWPPIDPKGWATARGYGERDLDESVRTLVERRAESVAWLEGLVDPMWDRSYEHPTVGTIRAGDLLTSWVAHDAIHIRQLNRLQRQFLEAELSEYSPAYAGPW